MKIVDVRKNKNINIDIDKNLFDIDFDVDKEIKKYLVDWKQESGNQPSLDAMRYFVSRYQNFEKNFEKEMKFIHVAGTNGKGSFVEMISNILINNNFRVGKYISPHLIKYNERISINNNLISDEEILALKKELILLIKEYYQDTNNKVTWFDFETFMALLYFFRSQVDFVVLEVGLGGLYDSTNVISKPLLSVITSVGLDHMNVLGESLIEIAAQKAGIIKQDSITIIFSQSKDIDDLFETTAKQRNNKLNIVRDSDISNYKFDEKFQCFDYKDSEFKNNLAFKNIQVNLKGRAQVKNACMAIKAVEILNQTAQVQISEESVREGLRSVVHRGRFEVVSEVPLIVFDGAHNEPAIENFRNNIRDNYIDYTRIYLVAILKRKDYKKITELLLQDQDGFFVFTSGNNYKNNNSDYVSGEELGKIAQQILSKSKLKTKSKNKIFVKDLDEAIRWLRTDIYNDILFDRRKKTVSFVVGSFYIYEDVVKILEEQDK